MGHWQVIGQQVVMSSKNPSGQALRDLMVVGTQQFHGNFSDNQLSGPHAHLGDHGVLIHQTLQMITV